MANSNGTRKLRRKGYLAAIVVGTALSALGSAPAEAAPVKAVDDLSRYCTACWRSARLQPDYWPDCTQEVLTRLLERVNPRHWDRVLAGETTERKEFLRAIDAVKKRTQRAHRTAPFAGDVADDREPKRQTVDTERNLVLELARHRLSPRQARIVALSLDGWSVQDIADALELPATRVSDEKYKAIQKLRLNLASG